ncbi:MAG: hypothetical protein ACKOTD_07495 [Phycisphaerales bacterium]
MMEAAVQRSVGFRHGRAPAARTMVPQAAAVASQARRAVRALLAQRGGTMLLRLWSGGAELRIDCTWSGRSAELVFATRDEVVAAVLRALAPAFESECARCGIVHARITCSGPAARPAAA